MKKGRRKNELAYNWTSKTTECHIMM